MTTATQTRIDASKTSGEYQPLVPYAHPGKPCVVPSAEWRAKARAADAAANAELRPLLVEAGYVEHDGDWWSLDCQVKIVADYDHPDRESTMGVEIFRTSAAAYHWHEANGTYDALPLVEKFRISGADGGSTIPSWTLQRWLEQFDRHGMPRPGDGCR